MVLYKNRKRFEKLSIKIGMLFSRLGLSPNSWTLLSIIPALISAYFLVNKAFIEAALFFAVAAFLDLVDGSVARVTGRVSKFGAYLDTIVDRYVEAIILLSMLFIGLPLFNIASYYISASIFIYFVLFGSMMTSYTKAAAKEKGIVKEEIRGGLFERAERMIALFFAILSAQFNIKYLVAMLVILAIVTNYTALQRIWKIRKLTFNRKNILSN